MNHELFNQRPSCSRGKKHPSSESNPVSIQVHSQMMCGNIHEKLVKQQVSEVLCGNKSQRLSKLVVRAACGTFEEIRWQSETQEVIHISYDSSKKVENCHTSENVFSAIETNNELFLANVKCQLQNVRTPLNHTHVTAKPVHNISGYDSCCPRRIQTEETPCMSDVCVSVTNVDGNARRHALSHTEQQACNCHECGASFVAAGCQGHQESKHAGQGLQKCDAAFNCPSYLAHHERKHTTEKPHKCDVCGASFAHSCNLRVHKRMHKGEKPKKRVCWASFAHSHHLTYRKRTHTEEEQYKCNVCEATFARSLDLACHKRTHTGEKPYKCDVCEASFAKSLYLVAHKRTHTVEKPYKHDDCGESFIQSDNLNRHKRKHAVDNVEHAGKESYPCDVCGEFCAKKCRLECHRKAHTGENSTTCNDSDTSFVDASNGECSHVPFFARDLFKISS